MTAVKAFLNHRLCGKGSSLASTPGHANHSSLHHQVTKACYCYCYYTLFLPRGKVRLQTSSSKAAKNLPLVGLARSKPMGTVLSIYTDPRQPAPIQFHDKCKCSLLKSSESQSSPEHWSRVCQDCHSITAALFRGPEVARQWQDAVRQRRSTPAASNWRMAVTFPTQAAHMSSDADSVTPGSDWRAKSGLKVWPPGSCPSGGSSICSAEISGVSCRPFSNKVARIPWFLCATNMKSGG